MSLHTRTAATITSTLHPPLTPAAGDGSGLCIRDPIALGGASGLRGDYAPRDGLAFGDHQVARCAVSRESCSRPGAGTLAPLSGAAQ
jgi:hypothetical protein